MVNKRVKVTNPSGLNVKYAGMICDIAVNHDCKILLKKGADAEYNAKSILSVLGAAVVSGDEIEIVCNGADEKVALSELVELIQNRFGE